MLFSGNRAYADPAKDAGDVVIANYKNWLGSLFMGRPTLMLSVR